MFATLLGALPMPPSADGDEDAAIRVALVAQAGAGLELLADGGLRSRQRPVDEWLFAAAAADRPVKQSIRGPYSAARRAAESGRDRDRRTTTFDLAELLAIEVRVLAEAGCVFVEVNEPDAIAIGDSDTERSIFRDAHRRLIDGIGTRDALHLSLALTGGNADTAGAATFFDLAYASYAVDLIAGPDNWRLVTAAPSDRGIVCGALSPAADGDERPELLVWAAHYAASGRGLERVGLANAPGLERLPWDAAIGKVTRVAEAARIAGLRSPDAIAGSLDPRAVSSRSAALGRAERGPRRPRKRREQPPDHA